MLDDPVLGRLTDLEDNEIPQEIINAESLFIYNQNELLRVIDRKVSKYELNFLINEVKESNVEFWRELVKRISSYFSLNSLRNFLSINFKDLDFSKEAMRLCYYLKVYLPNKLSNFDISEKYFSNKNEFKQFLNEKNIKIVYMFNFAIEYIDRESFNSFINKIFKESKLEYME